MSAPDTSEAVAASDAAPGERVTLPVEVRCPENPSKLFLRMRAAGVPMNPEAVAVGEMELSCRACRQDVRLLQPGTGRRPKQVLHRFDLAGQPVGHPIVSY